MWKRIETSAKRLIRRGKYKAPLAFPPGHFYSPVCDLNELSRLYRDPAEGSAPHALPGIALDRDRMLALWGEWGALRAAPRPGAIAGSRYRPDNGQYGPGDALVLSLMLRHVRPKRIIEIGSGHSSAVMLDTIEHHLNGGVECTFIDPYPQRLRSLLTGDDSKRYRIIEQGIQYVDVAIVDDLQSGDILFIDSTHIVKTGSDVVSELFVLLPRLKSGVHIHFHDMFWPFEYPRSWVMEQNFSWNELYAVRAFLMYNSNFEIVFFGDYLWMTARDLIAKAAPELTGLGGNIWLRKM